MVSFVPDWYIHILTVAQNMHELACVSGIAAAYRLGADYVKFDDFAEDFFREQSLKASLPSP